MSPLEDPLLLFAIVRRHLQVLQLGLDEAYLAEDWGFTAQQAVEELLKAWIVLNNGQPLRVHDPQPSLSFPVWRYPRLCLHFRCMRLRLAMKRVPSPCQRSAPRSWRPSSNCSLTASTTLRAES